MNDNIPVFLTGLGIGLFVGVLCAPYSGEKTRRLIRTKANEGSAWVTERASDIRNSTTEMMEKGKKAVEKQTEGLAEAVQAGKKAYYHAVG